MMKMENFVISYCQSMENTTKVMILKTDAVINNPETINWTKASLQSDIYQNASTCTELINYKVLFYS